MRKVKKKTTHAQEMKAMVSVMNPTEKRMDHVKLFVKRKKRAKETRARLQPEAEFRNNEFIPFLEKKAYAWFRIENGITGKHGNSLSDYLVFFSLRKDPITKENINDVPPLLMVFIELKSDVGTLSPGQKVFKELVDAVVKEPMHIKAKSIKNIENGIRAGDRL